MALCEIHLGSNHALQKVSALNVIVPELPGPFPVWYLLHGLSDDHTGWSRRTNIERYVSGLPFLVVMPDGGRGFYTDAHDDPMRAYETFLARDLINFIDMTFQTIPSREGRVVSGLSMGGYGAAKLALKHPDKYRAAVSHSGALAMAHYALDGDDAWHREFRPVFGAHPEGGPDDLFALASNIDRALLPALRIDCGVDDFLLESNRSFHAHLEQIGLPHEYEEFPGAHTWNYWDTHVHDAIAFFKRELNLPA